MKKLLTICALALCSFAISNAQDTDSNSVKGWNIGPLPVVSYNSDLGFQYGFCADAFYYGDGSIFPDYLHRFYVEASRYTGGQTLLHAQYDSKHLIPGIRTTAAISWQHDPLYYFYGFGGNVAYNPELNLNTESGVAAYSLGRDMIRVLLDFQGPITENLNWLAGTSFYNMVLSDHKFDTYDPSTSLYHQYVQSGLIPANEALGGSHLEFKAGLVYDSRDQEACPTKGIMAEAFVNGSPALGANGTSYLKAVLRFRQYLSLYKDRAIFAYHAGYQGTLAGHTPFDMLPVVYNLFLRQTNSEGLGGSCTVRGLIQNRLIGQDFAWLNAELRLKVFKFNLLGMNWYAGVNPFFDAGYVFKGYYREDLMDSLGLAHLDKPENFNCSAGLGLKLAMNENFIISVEAAQVLGHPEYPMGMAIVMNYLF